MSEFILAIDPGNVESAYALLDEDLRPLKFGKFLNEIMFANACDAINSCVKNDDILHVCIEMIASYGMAVGKEVFETCIWIGQLKERFERAKKQNEPFISDIRFIYRKDEKMNLCHSMRASDANIIQALVDRFASGEPNHGKGTKKSPGWFYGFRKDIWQAYAVGITYADLYLRSKS